MNLGYLRIKKPNKIMIEHANKLKKAKLDMTTAKMLGHRHILEIEAEAAMYKHAMNLSEEMWKHYSQSSARSKKPNKQLLKSMEQAQIDFQFYSTKYENLMNVIKKRIG